MEGKGDLQKAVKYEAAEMEKEEKMRHSHKKVRRGLFLVCLGIEFELGLFLLGSLSVAMTARDRSNMTEMTVESVCLKMEVGSLGGTTNEIYITTDQGLFSINYERNQGLLLLEPQDKVSIGYSEKATAGPTEISGIEVNYSSNPDVIVHEKEEFNNEIPSVLALAMGVVGVFVVVAMKKNQNA